MKCDFCYKEVCIVSILGIMPSDRIEGRLPAQICLNCQSLCPCGHKGYWNKGLLSCKHGYIYDIDYVWNDNVAQLNFEVKKTKMVEFFKIFK